MSALSHIYRFRGQCLGLAILLLAVVVQAAPVRVTTWNLLSAEPGADVSAKISAGQLQEAAEALKKLKPDVIVLQHAPDWSTCDQLAKSLKPENYYVVTCSAFRNTDAKSQGHQQVAILSRAKAYISWAEAWHNTGESTAPGGFAFAAIRLADKNLGIFSVALGEQQKSREESSRQLVQQLASLQNWTTNRLDSFVVAGDFNTTLEEVDSAHEKTLPQLERAGFENLLAVLPLERRVTLPGNARRPDATVDYIFTRDAGRVTGLQIFQSALSEHCAVTCDFDPSATPLARPALPAANFAASADKSAPAPADALSGNRQLLWITVGFAAGCIAIFLIMRSFKRAARSATAGLLADGSSTDGLVVASPPRSPFVHITVGSGAQIRSQSQSQPRPETAPDDVKAGVIEQLTRWLKQKMVQRLVSDRAQLLAVQEAAARRMLAVDERLALVEQQIRNRNHEYEQRIDELEIELATALEENRELIRAKIALVKAEMEKERLKAEQYLKSHQQN